METRPSKEDDAAYDIRVSIGHPDADVDPAAIVRAIRLTLSTHHCRACNLSVALVDAGTMKDLHQRYLKEPVPTDVLSFNLGNGSGHGVDGEIVIGVEAARQESRHRGHTIGGEILLYAIHGTLHLLGYDDRSPEEADRMHAREDELLTALGLGPIYGGRKR